MAIGVNVTNPVMEALNIEYDLRKFQPKMAENHVMVALEKIGNATRTNAQVYNLVDTFTTSSGTIFLILNIGNIV